jgi:hypothetical protein
MSRFLSLARWSNLYISALTTAVFFGTRVALSPSSRSFSGPVYVAVQQATIRNLYPVMGVLMPASMVSHGVVLLLLRHRRTRLFWTTAISLVMTLGGAVSTLRGNFPINDQVITWTAETLPDNWQHLRDRWEHLHTFRTLLALIGLGALIAGATPDNR